MASSHPAPSFESSLRLFSSQTFSVTRVQRFGGSYGVELYVSTDKLEIRPYARAGPFSKQKPVWKKAVDIKIKGLKGWFFPLDTVAHCFE